MSTTCGAMESGQTAAWSPVGTKNKPQVRKM